MKHLFSIGDKKYHEKVVGDQDLASFESGIVHKVCSTFALAREIEWASRLFVLEMLEEFEEGIGTELRIIHKSPAIEGERLMFEATITRLEGHELYCDIIVSVGKRVIAQCTTGQKILAKTKVDEVISRIHKK